MKTLTESEKEVLTTAIYPYGKKRKELRKEWIYIDGIGWYDFLLSCIWLEYFNDLLTVERFAEYHCVSVELMDRILLQGKEANKLLGA